MNHKEARKRFEDKTRELTELQTPYSVGDMVEDVVDKNKGIVVKIELGVNKEDHGTIYVWQLNRINYGGGDNCETYAEFNCRDGERLKILKKAGT